MLAHTESPKGDNEDKNDNGVDDQWSRNVTSFKVPTKTTDIRKIKGWQKKSFAITDKINNSLTVFESQQKLERRKINCLESEESLLVESATTTVRNKSDLKQQMDLENQGKPNVYTCSDAVNTVDQEKSSSFNNEIITEFKRKFCDSFVNNSERFVCKKVKFQFPANDEVFSENFLLGDLKKGRASVTVASKSAFVSEELQNFLNFNSKLNIDYEIPQLEAADHISHDEMSVVFPMDTPSASKVSEKSKSNSFQQNSYVKFKQGNIQVQRSEGFSGATRPKPKTVAEKRRLLEQEMKLIKSKKASQNIKGHAVGTRTKIKQEMQVNLSHNEKQIIQGNEGRNRKRNDHVNTSERRSSNRLLLWNKKDGDSEDNENRLPNLKSTNYAKEEVFSDEDSNVIREKLVKKKTNKKFKKLETHIKLFKKLDSLPKRINNDLELSECNIAEEMANLTGNTSKVGMILNIGVGRHLYDEAVHNLELVQGDSVIIKESTAKLAACAVVDHTAQVTVKRILVPVVCSKLINLMYQASEEKRRQCSSRSIQNKPQHENVEDDNVDIDSFDDDDDDPSIVDDEALRTLVDIVKYVVEREETESLEKDIVYDPDVPEPVVTKKSADYASKYKKLTNKRVGDKVASQLSKLGVTLIDFDDESVSTKKYKQKECSKEYCKLGCVCESLQVPRHVTHCGNSSCMLKDTCSCSLYDKLKEKLSPSILRIQNETEKKMAKEERKYHQTIIMSKDKMVYSESDKRKREIKLPVKYRDDLIILSDDEELLTAEYESSKPKKRLAEKMLKTKKQSSVKVNNQRTHEESQIKLNYNIKPCYVNLEKIDTSGIKILCLFHCTYDCQCLKSSDESKSDSGVKEHEIVKRNVAKKKTSGAITNKIKKCKFCEGSCVCSISSNQAGFGVIQEVMSLEPEEFYGTASDTSVSDIASKSRCPTNISSEGNSRYNRLCNNCKCHSNVRFNMLNNTLSSATAPLPVIYAPCRWWVIELEHDDSMIIRNTLIGLDIPYTKLFEVIKAANNRRKTVSLLLKGTGKNKLVYHDRYGAYAVPKLTRIIFFGPYDVNENHNLKAFRLIKRKGTVRVPFLNENKSYLFPETKSDKQTDIKVMSVCDMCKQHFDYGVNSSWWYSESCRNHLIKKRSNQVAHSNYERNILLGVEQTKSNRSTMEDVIVMETLNIEEHGVDVIKNEVRGDEVDDFISFEEKELQNLMDEHILDKETSDKPDDREIQNVTNKQHLLIYSVSQGKNKINNETCTPFNLNDSKTGNFIVKNVPRTIKMNNNYFNYNDDVDNNGNDGDGGNNNDNKTVNRTNEIRKRRNIMNKGFKKLEKGDSDGCVKIRICGRPKNVIKPFEKGLKHSLTHPVGEKMQQSRVESNTESLQNGIVTNMEMNKDFSHLCYFISQKEKEKGNRKLIEFSNYASVNESQPLLNVTQAEVNSIEPHFTENILVDNSSAQEDSILHCAQEELEVLDYYDHLEAECLSDEDDNRRTDSDNSDEEVVFDTIDPQLILHKPKRDLPLVNFGAKITKSVLCMERSHSECDNLPKAVLFCEVPGIDAIPVIEFDEQKLVIADPLKNTIRHQFQHSVYASQWLEKLFTRYMVFSDEVKLSWSLITNEHLIAKLRLFNPEILTDLKLIVTPTGIEELVEDDIDSLKKLRYRIKFEYNRKRLEHLVAENEELSDTNLHNLLTEAASKVKELTKESIEIASNLSHFGRTNRQLKNKLQSLLTDLNPETQLKAKQLIKEVKYQELLKHFYCKDAVPSGHTVRVLEEIDLEATDDEDEDSDVEVVSTYIPEFGDTRRTVPTNLKRQRVTEEQESDNSEAKKQKCPSPSGKILNSNNYKGVSAQSATVTYADKAEFLSVASETETSENVIDLEKGGCICSCGKNKNNYSSGGRSVNISVPEGMLEDHVTTTASKSYGYINDVTMLPQQLHGYEYGPVVYEPINDDTITLNQQSRSHQLSDIDNVKRSDSTVQTNSVTLGDITSSNGALKVLCTPKLAFRSLPSQKLVSGFPQNNNVSYVRTKIPLKNNEKRGETTATRVPASSRRELSNHCNEWVTVNAAEVNSPETLTLDNNEVYVVSNSLYNGEKTVILEKQDKNTSYRNVVVPRMQPKRMHVVYNKNEKSILGKAKPKRLLVDTENISQCMKMSLKPCVRNTETEDTCTKAIEYKQKFIPAVMCLPNGQPIVLRNNNVRKVKVIKPESIVKPKFFVKRGFDGISVNDYVSDGTLENTGQQFSPDLLNKTDEYISQELSSDPSNITQDHQNVGQLISPVFDKSVNTSKGTNLNGYVSNDINQQFSINPSNKTCGQINQQISSDLSVTQSVQNVVNHISPILYTLSNSGKKRIFIEVTKQENTRSNNPKNTADFAEIETCRELTVNRGSSSMAANFQNNLVNNTRNPNVVPKYVLSAKPRPQLPTSSLQNAYIVRNYSPRQPVKLVTAPNYSGRSVLVSHQPNSSNVGYSTYQPVQMTDQNIRWNTEEHIFRPRVSGTQSVRPNVVLSQFNTGRGVCTINPGTRKPQSILSCNTIEVPLNTVHFKSRLCSGPTGRLSSVETPVRHDS